MLVEAALLATKLAEIFGDSPTFPAVPAGSTLSEGQRYAIFAIWPAWLTRRTGRLRADEAYMRGDLEAIGLDVALLVERADGFVWLAEPQNDAITVTDVQRAIGARGGLGIVCSSAGSAELLPELALDAWEALQSAADGLERTDPSWWTRGLAIGLTVAAVVIGAIALAVVIYRRRRK